MKIYIKHIPLLFLILLIIVVFKAWFTPGLITAGDFWPYSKLIYSVRSIIPYAWDLNNGSGLGVFVGPLLWIYLNFGTPNTVLGSFLGLGWSVIERIWYLYPFLILSIISSYKLFSKVISPNKFAILAASIFTLNSYILMIVGGGQIAGIGMAYCLIPFILYLFVSIAEAIKDNKNVSGKSLFAGVLFSLQFIFDIRVAYITLSAVFLLSILNILKTKAAITRVIVYMLIVPGIIVFFLNAFWIFPTLANGKNPVEQMGLAYSSNQAVEFFSFAKFEDTISFVHPNWPENIFGKVGFLKPEFLLLPILAYLSLLIKTEDKKKRMYILFFVGLGLLGAFLAKGANEPFGGFYIWLFNHFPGFIMFRDPTKWYILIAVSYSILIPFTISKLYGLIKSQTRFKINSKNQLLSLQNIFLTITLLYLAFLINPAILGHLNGTFKTTQIPYDYVKLETYLSNQPEFFRTFWLPTVQRFGYYSNNHPAIPSQVYFNKQDSKDLISLLKNPNTQENLTDAGVRYVIVPYDSQGEIYLKDRKYDSKIYANILSELKKIPWLKKVEGFGRIGVFQFENQKDHFWTDSKLLTISSKYISPVEYDLTLKNSKAGDTIVFSDSYDPSWVAKSEISIIRSSPFESRFNSFTLPQNLDHLKIYYTPQKYVDLGALISVVTFLILIVYFISRNILKK